MENNNKKSVSSSNHEILISIGVIIIILLIVFIGVVTKDNNDKTLTTNKSNIDITSNITKEPNIVFSNMIQRRANGYTIVNGNVTNNDSVTHDFLIDVAFYDSNGKLIGVSHGAVNDLVGKSTKTFEAITPQDYSKASSFTVQVGSMSN